MQILGICVLILILYARTYKYHILIDDPVKRGDYLTVIPEKKWDPKVYDVKRSPLYTLTNIGVFMATCWVISLLWGWKVALLYALLPTNVSGVAWATGNYYMTTVFLTLTTYFFSFYGIEGVLFSLPFYYAALHSTVSAIPYLFASFFLVGAPSVLYIVPWCMFIFGKRLRYGLNLRKKGHDKIGVTSGVFRMRHLFVVPKVIAYYTMLNFWPSRLAFFNSFGKDEFVSASLSKPTRLFWISVALLLTFSFWAIPLDWRAWLWWILFIGIFSQFIVFGQFTTERYMYLANVGFCVLVGKFLEPYPYVFAVLCALWFYRSHIYISAWKHNLNLFSYSVSAYPDCPENYVNLSSYYLENKQYLQAIKPLLCAIENSSGNKFKLYGNLATCYGAYQEYGKALRCVEEALSTCSPDMREKLLHAKENLENMARRTGRLKKQIGDIAKEYK